MMNLFSLNTRRVTARRGRFSGGTSLQQLELLETRALLAAFTVNTDQDVTSPDDNLLSLREAVAEVNLSTDLANTIEFDASLISHSISMTQGTLQLFKNVSIVGLGAADLTVQRSTAEGTPQFGIFYIGSNATVEISGLTIANGKTDTWGGGILNDGTLVIANSTLTGNASSYGGAIFTEGPLTVSDSALSGNSASVSGGAIDSRATLTVTRSTLSGNSATHGGAIVNWSQSTVIVSHSTLSHNSVAGGGGGAIFSYGPLTVSDSILADNSSDYYAGGIASGGPLTISNSTLSRNSSFAGGAIHSAGPLTVSDSTFEDNKAVWYGAAIMNSGPLTVSQSTFKDNSVVGGVAAITNNFSGTVTVTHSTFKDNYGSGVAHYGGLLDISRSTFSGNSGGGIFNNSALTVSNSILTRNSGGAIINYGNLTVSRSTLSDNANSEWYGGGAISNFGTVAVSDSTLSGNSANSGGGIASSGRLTVSNSTLSGNSAINYGGGIYSRAPFDITNSTLTGNSAGYGGGIATDVYDDSPVSERKLANTIIAGNHSGYGPDIGGRVMSLGHNLVGVIDSSSGWTGTDLTGTSGSPLDPLLGALQDNGGPTWTMALLADSPAINQGNNFLADSSPYDQRGPGYSRILGGTVDIGAFEKILNKPPIADAGGPYSVLEGGRVVLDGSGSSDPDQPAETLNYEWDLDGDNVFGESGAAATRGDEVGPNPEFSPVGLDGPGFVTVTFRVTDNSGLSNTAATNITIANVAPELTSVVSTAPEVCESSSDGHVAISGSFADVGTLDTHTVLVNWGDGSPVESVTVNQNANTFSGSHIYATGGVFTVTVTAVDDDGGVSTDVFSSAVVQGVGVVNGTLYIIGTDGRDKVDLKFNEKKDELKVDVKLDQGGRGGGSDGGCDGGPGGSDGGSDDDEGIRQTFDISAIDRIVAYLCEGDDHYNGGSDGGSDGGPDHDRHQAAISQFVFGGGGDDNIQGGRGNDVLIGGAGKDDLDGGSGADILIGGIGKDNLKGGRGNDLLIGGSTAANDDFVALDQALAAWSSDDLSAALNYVGTVTDDNHKDELFGEQGDDYLYYGNGDKRKN